MFNIIQARCVLTAATSSSLPLFCRKNIKKSVLCKLICIVYIAATTHSIVLSQTYKIVGTGVTSCYGNTTTIACPTSPSAPFYGQFPGVTLPSYQNNGNGTITDLNTGLTWQSNPDANGDNDGIMEKTDKLTWTQIQARVLALNSSNYGGHDDWRIPTIKELYSLTNWNGTDPSGYAGTGTTGLTPFIDNAYFPFAWGQTSAGERLIDVQYASSNMYNELSFAGYQQLFGFNFADGRIKGYDLIMPGGANKVFSFIAVRGNPAYGINSFVDNGDSTITDNATGLMWSKNDSRTGMSWQSALAWAQTKNAANYCGHNDWRLPNAKELQSIVDYTRSPGSTNSAAIDPIFNCTSITNEAGRLDWPWFWTSTTHRSYNGTSYGGANGIYVCFGRAAGWVKIGTHTFFSYCDVHGAGAQRSSPKSGTFLGDYMGVDSLGHSVYGLGPQGDILRTNNFVRLVRDGGITGTDDRYSEASAIPSRPWLSQNYPNPFNPETGLRYDIGGVSGQGLGASHVRLAVYDILGREVTVLVNERKPPGSYEVKFNASNLSSGVYLYRITAGTFVQTRKMIVAR